MSVLNPPTQGVFKIPVEEKFVYYYAQSQLLCVRDKLHVPDRRNGFRKFMLPHVTMQMGGAKENNLEFMARATLGSYQRFCGVQYRNAPNCGKHVFFCTNHLVDCRSEAPVSKLFSWLEFLYSHDRIMPRIILIQNWVRSRIIERKKRLHFLAILLTKQRSLHADVVCLIAAHL